MARRRINVLAKSSKRRFIANQDIISPMEIIFFRHGLAGDKTEWAETGKPDSERPLTKEGKEKTKEAADGLAAFVEKADLVATSPWKRARQTAELASKSLKAPLAETDLLLPHRSGADLSEWLSGLEGERVVLVGHEPHLSRVVTWLLSGAERPVVALKKAQALCVETNRAARGTGVLLWSLPPKALRALG